MFVRKYKFKDFDILIDTIDERVNFYILKLETRREHGTVELTAERTAAPPSSLYSKGEFGRS